jgi:nucleoside-diphosphate-sugar epimerase
VISLGTSVLINILLIGASGNLGSQIEKFFKSLGFKVFRGVKTPNSMQDILVNEFQEILIPNGLRIDLVVNASNRYFVNASPHEIELMHDSIIGISSSIAKTKLDCPIVFFSTYLQYIKNAQESWSSYTDLKMKSTEIMRIFSEETSTTVLELVLYDNYGGHRKNKFFDLALNSVFNGLELLATPGESVLNLTYISDIVNSLGSIFGSDSPLLQEGGLKTFSIYSKDTYTLRNLVNTIEEISGKTASIKWGALPYRAREVFEFVPTSPLFPDFVQTKSVVEYISAMSEF